jgi:hypothetical protein
MPAGNLDAWWRVYFRSRDVIKWARANGHHKDPTILALKKALLEEKARQLADEEMTEFIGEESALVYRSGSRLYLVSPNPMRDFQVCFSVYWHEEGKTALHRYTGLADNYTSAEVAQEALEAHAAKKRKWELAGRLQIGTLDLLPPSIDPPEMVAPKPMAADGDSLLGGL